MHQCGKARYRLRCPVTFGRRDRSLLCAAETAQAPVEVQRRALGAVRQDTQTDPHHEAHQCRARHTQWTHCPLTVGAKPRCCSGDVAISCVIGRGDMGALGETVVGVRSGDE